jgi:hypothetical protein
LGAEGRGFESLRPDHLKYLPFYSLIASSPVDTALLHVNSRGED